MTEEEVKLITRQLLKDGMIEENEVDGRKGYTITEKGRKKRMEEDDDYLTVEKLMQIDWSYACVHLVSTPFLKAIPMERAEGWTGDILCEWCAKRDIHELLEGNQIVIFTKDDLEEESFIAG